MSEKREGRARPSLSGRRASKSADAARAAELARIAAMSPIERMGIALALGRRRQALATQRGGDANR